MSHQSHHMLPKGPQGNKLQVSETPIHRRSGHSRCDKPAGKHGKNLEFRILSSLQSLRPRSYTFFLLLKESALKPDTWRVEGGNFCTFGPRGPALPGVLMEGMAGLPSIQIAPLRQGPAHSPLQASPSPRLLPDSFYGVFISPFIRAHQVFPPVHTGRGASLARMGSPGSGQQTEHCVEIQQPQVPIPDPPLNMGTSHNTSGPSFLPLSN